MKSTTARRDVGRMGSVRGLGSMGSQGKIIWMNICGRCICWICRRVRGGRGVGDGFLGVLSLLSLLSFPFLPFLFYSFVLWSIFLGRVFLHCSSICTRALWVLDDYLRHWMRVRRNFYCLLVVLLLWTWWMFFYVTAFTMYVHQY